MERLDELEARLDQLAAENRRLRTRLSGSDVDANGAATVQIDRRTALRNLAAAAAGGVGLAAAGGVLAPQAANAANGDPIVIGQTNFGSLQTELSSDVFKTSATAQEAALKVLTNEGANAPAAWFEQGSFYTDGTVEYGYPALTIRSARTPGYRGLSGSLFVADAGGARSLYFYHTGEDDKGASEVGHVHTSFFSNFTNTQTPERVMDTRPTAPLFNAPTGTLGTGGRLDSSLGGGVYNLDLSGDVSEDCVAVMGTLTTTQALANGFVTVWGTGTQPTASNINYNTTVPSVATLALIPLSATKTIQIATKPGAAVHVLFDLVGQVRTGQNDAGSFSPSAAATKTGAEAVAHQQQLLRDYES